MCIFLMGPKRTMYIDAYTILQSEHKSEMIEAVRVIGSSAVPSNESSVRIDLRKHISVQ